MFWICGFVLSTLFVVYILFGYPLILLRLVQTRRRPIRRMPIYPSVSVILAVHNGERFIDQKLRSILALDYPREKMEIIVASDGSTDTTDALIQKFSGEGVRLLRLPRGGKSAALNSAIVQASHEILVFTDVRQLLAPDSLAFLMENFADPNVGAVSAELVILRGNTREEADVGLYWRYELWIRLRLSEIDSIFGATGAYYALRRELAVPLPADALLDDMYLPLAAFFRGRRLILDPRARMFDLPTGLHAEFQRKVRTLAGNYQILKAYPALLGPRNRMWFHFVSYKFGRLVLPFALLLIAVCGFGIPEPWRTVAVASQACFYLAALVDWWIPENPLRKITSPIRTFVTLMAATFCALSVVFVPSSKLWKTTGGR